MVKQGINAGQIYHYRGLLPGQLHTELDASPKDRAERTNFPHGKPVSSDAETDAISNPSVGHREQEVHNGRRHRDVPSRLLFSFSQNTS